MCPIRVGFDTVEACRSIGFKINHSWLSVVVLCAGAPADDVEYELIKKQFEEMCEFLAWDLDFYKAFYATEKDEIANNADALAEMKAIGEKFS